MIHLTEVTTKWWPGFCERHLIAKDPNDYFDDKYQEPKEKEQNDIDNIPEHTNNDDDVDID